MPTFPLGKGAFLSVNGTTYSDSSGSVDAEITVDEVDNTVFSTSFHKSKQPGLIDDTFSYEIKYSQTVYAALRTLALARTSHDTILGPEGNVAGKEKITFTGFIAKLGRKHVTDDLILITVDKSVTTDAAYTTW
jgi:hypothetical protein